MLVAIDRFARLGTALCLTVQAISFCHTVQETAWRDVVYLGYKEHGRGRLGEIRVNKDVGCESGGHWYAHMVTLRWMAGQRL